MPDGTIVDDTLLVSLEPRSSGDELAYRDTASSAVISPGCRDEVTYPKLASCQLMKHRIAVFQLSCDAGDKYTAPTIAKTCRAALSAQ